jgi:hypothetical protein
MSIFTLSTGQRATGAVESAFAPTSFQIPNGTMALAMLEKCEKKSFTYDGEQVVFFNVDWKLLNSPFKGFSVRQKIDIYAEKAAKADRAKEMFMLLFKLCNVNPTASGPTENELFQLQHKVCGLRIMEWDLNGKQGNWVAELHPSIGFIEAVGTKMATKPASASMHNEINPPFMDDDVSALNF